MAQAAEVFAVVMRERAMSLSDREWKHRLLGHGYKLDETGEGTLVRSAARGERLCMLPVPAEA
ncbi:hypothetical protein E0K89_019205 [Aquicoccus sp. SCR17]|nr:hypothetical protein [Carideicomes alvinocaridis]